MERDIGGLRCGQVLELLDAFLDGSLDPAALAHVRAHLAGCSNCERFGGRYATTVETLREMAPPPAAEVKDRLLDRLFSR